MSAAEEVLAALAASLLEGQSVNWEAAERTLTAGAERRVIRQLMTLEQIIRSHQDLFAKEGVEGPSSATDQRGPSSSPEERQRGWRWGRLSVLEPVGSGAFGEVYRAWDHGLAREVALKLIRKGTGASLVGEARLLARVRHPNVIAIHEVDSHDGIDGFWMEFVRGRTLAQCVRDRGPLGPREAALIGLDLCRALAAVHGAGLVHGDVKAQNVMREDGDRIVLMDFGTGVFTEEEVDRAAAGLSGTPLYLAPEVLQGETRCPQTDLYSLGVLLYYLVTGSYPVQASTLEGLREAHARRMRTLLRDVRPGLPAAFVGVVEQALAPRAERFRSAGEMERALVRFLEASMSTGGGAPRRVRQALALFVAGGLAAGAAAWILARPAPSARHSPKRFNIGLPAMVPVADVISVSSVALSPDGTRLVYAGAAAGRLQLYLRAMDQIDVTPIPGTEGGSHPFFSPDGQWLGFSNEGSVKKIPIQGGDPVTLCAAPRLRGASWGADGTILFAPDAYGGLLRVSDEGGTPQVVTTPDPARNEDSHRWPHFLPGGKAALFATATPSTRDDERAIAVLSLGTGRWRILIQGGTYPRYLTTGHLLFARGGSLMAVPFDLGRLELAGPAVPVLEGVRMPRGTGAAQFDVSQAGSLVYVRGAPRLLERTLVWVDRRGSVQPLTQAQRPYADPALSPDGGRLAVTIEGSNDDVWVCDLGRDTWTRLTFEGDNYRPVWSPDGTRVAFSSNRNGSWNLYWVRADGGGSAEGLTGGKEWSTPDSFSPDGAVIAFHRENPVSGWDIAMLPLVGDRTPRPFLVTRLYESVPAFSPDGRWVAHVSGEAGRYDVYVRPYPRPDRKYLISADTGTEPVWSRDGREIFYRSGDKMIAVPVRTKPDFHRGAPQVLFEARFERSPATPNYDVSPDGRRFVMIKNAPKAEVPPEIVIVPDWSEELQAKLR